MATTVRKALGWMGLFCGAMALLAVGCGGSGGGGGMFPTKKRVDKKPTKTAKNDETDGKKAATAKKALAAEAQKSPAPSTAAETSAGEKVAEKPAAEVDELESLLDERASKPKSRRRRGRSRAVGRLSKPAATKLDALAKQRAIKQQALFAEAQGHYQAGRRLYDDVQYEEAVKQFEKALEYYPNHARARQYLRKSRALLGVRTDRVFEALKQLSMEKRVKIQEALVQMENAFEKARQFHKRSREWQEGEKEAEDEAIFSRRIRDLSRALDAYERVLEIIKWMPYNIELSGTRGKAQAMRRDAQKEKINTERALRAHQIRKARARAHKEREKEIRFHRSKIEKLSIQATVHFQKEQYKACEALCLKILELDPGNGDIQLLFNRARGKKHEMEERATHHLRRHERSNSLLNVSQAAIPYDRRLVYPDYWEKIVRRIEKGGIGGSTVEQEWQKEIRRKLQRKVSFEFVDTPLSEAIQFLQTLTKVNMILDPQIEGGGDTPINLKIQNMSLELALNWILKLSDLDYALKDDAIFISRPDRLVGEVVLKIYDVADLVSIVPDFPGPDFALTVGGQTDAGGGGLAVFEQPAEEQMDASSLAEMIQTRVKPDSWAPELGTSIEMRGNRLVVMQRPEVHRLIDNLLANFRAAQKLLVTIEARFLTIREGFFEDIGFDWGGPIVGATGLGNALGTTITSDTLTAPVEAGFVNRPDSVDYFGRGVLHTIGAVTNNNVNFSPESNPIIDSPPNLARLSQGLNASITHIGSIEAQALLHAIRIREAGSMLSAPRLTVYNTQRAHMFTAEQTSYIADYEISGDSYDPIIRQFLRGVIFDVRPIVSADRRYITLELRPTTIDLVEITTINIQTISVFDTDPPVIVALSLPVQFPELTLTKVRTTVTIPDGGIILIGGMMKDTKFHAESGVPFISNIPVIGKLFRWDRVDNEKSNLIIMVTARILLFDEEERKF